jgi:hypothetical protein
VIVIPSPPITESSDATLDTFVVAPLTHAPPEVPITAEPPTTTAFTPPPIADPTLEDIQIPKDETSTPSEEECEAPPEQELISTEVTGTRTQDHTPLQELLPPPESVSNDEVVDVAEQQSTPPPSPPADTPPQREEDLDSVILAEPQVVAPPQLAPPGEGRFSDDWAASVLKAATASP